MEDCMSHLHCRLRLASVVAVSFAITTASAFAAQDEHSTRAAVSDRVAQAQSTTPPAAGDDATTGSTQKNDATSKQKTRHPPTAQMDKATPTQKTPTDMPAAKHPPTRAMDQATPDEKSPKSAQ